MIAAGRMHAAMTATQLLQRRPPFVAHTVLITGDDDENINPGPTRKLLKERYIPAKQAGTAVRHATIDDIMSYFMQDMLWTDKYKPTASSHVFGNSHQGWCQFDSLNALSLLLFNRS